MVGKEAALEIWVLHRHGKGIREIARGRQAARGTRCGGICGTNQRRDTGPGRRERRVKALEQPRSPACPHPGPRQRFAKEPDRVGVRHRVVQGQADKPHKRQPVLQLIFGLVVGQRVQGLQHQHLEHEHRVGWRPSALGPIRARQRLFQTLATQFEIDDLRSRSSGSPAADHALVRSSPSKNPGCPATANPPHPPIAEAGDSSSKPTRVQTQS